MAQAFREAWADTEFYKTRFQEQIDWIRENKNAKHQVQKLFQEDNAQGKT